ncbi:MAG TPA: DNA oxidative demethylase AlkB [Steroidobacteraceae bacterium]
MTAQRAASRSLELFGLEAAGEPEAKTLAPGAVLLHGLAAARAPLLLSALEQILRRAPFRHMATPGGLRMSVAMTNCGTAGWVSDRRGYRYDRADPQSGQRWPAMPEIFAALATEAAAMAGFKHLSPDACLVNRYAPGTRLSLHQDRNEQDFTAPIVSVSLGLPAMFLFGGLRRAERAARVPLTHGDVVVWGGPSRLRFHGVLPLQDGIHPLTGPCRLNLTFRWAL